MFREARVIGKRLRFSGVCSSRYTLPKSSSGNLTSNVPEAVALKGSLCGQHYSSLRSGQTQKLRGIYAYKNARIPIRRMNVCNELFQVF